jgi:hypothetical protein
MMIAGALMVVIGFIGYAIRGSRAYCASRLRLFFQSNFWIRFRVHSQRVSCPQAARITVAVAFNDAQSSALTADSCPIRDFEPPAPLGWGFSHLGRHRLRGADLPDFRPPNA